MGRRKNTQDELRKQSNVPNRYTCFGGMRTGKVYGYYSDTHKSLRCGGRRSNEVTGIRYHLKHIGVMERNGDCSHSVPITSACYKWICHMIMVGMLKKALYCSVAKGVRAFVFRHHFASLRVWATHMWSHKVAWLFYGIDLSSKLMCFNSEC